jgi:LacI family transcriptional regulator
MQRPTIADLALAAEVSVSTVDRVLNGRDPVRPATAQRVLAAAEAIGFYGTGAIRQRLGQDKPERTFAFVLLQRPRPFYQVLGEALTEATRTSPTIRGQPVITFMDDLTPAAVADRLVKLAKSVDSIAVVTADHPHVTQAIDRLNGNGIPVFALISDLTAQGRAGYVGLDNLKVGRTAGWAVANLCKHPGKVGIFVGSHRYLCQDLCEMGFRSYFREHAPDFRVLEARTSLEESRYAYETTLDLLKRNPDLVGLFVAGGGIRGVMRALRDEGPGVFRQLVTVGLDLMDETRSGLIDNALKLVLAHPIKRLAETAVSAMVRATEGSTREPFTQRLLPFDIYTAENV